MGQGLVGPLVVVAVLELVRECLEVLEGGRLDSLGAQSLLQGLLEAFDFALGLWVAAAAVGLVDLPPCQEGLEAVAAWSPGEPGGVDHAVVGQGGGGSSVLVAGRVERGHHQRAGDPSVSGEVQGVAAAVIQPGDDLAVGAVG